MSSPKRIGIYPGSFDPITYGHLDIIRRCAGLVDELIIGIARHSGKDALFTPQQRLKLIEETLPSTDIEQTGMTLRPMVMDGLLIDFVRQQQARVVFRGLRAVADFDYEFQMAMMNTRLAPDIETVFLMASEKHQFIASKLVKEVARLGGDVSTFVPPQVLNLLNQRETFMPQGQ